MTTQGVFRLEDEDKDYLEIKEVYGFGQRRLLIRITQEGDESQITLNEEQVRELIEQLRKFGAMGVK